MWLYVPPMNSESSPCALVSEASRKESTQHAQDLASSVTWRGSLRQRHFWSKAWKKVPWLQRLSGTTLQPSTADHGVALWISSLRASLVNPTASPDSGEVTLTSEHGAQTAEDQSSTQSESYPSVVPPWCSSRTYLRGLLPDTSEISVKSYAEWVTRSCARSSYERRTLARRKSESESSSSAVWQTPKLPTGSNKTRSGARSNELLLLGQAAAWWSTPSAIIPQDGEGMETFLERQKVLKDKHLNGNGCGTPLTIASLMWSTPRSSPNENRQTKPTPSQQAGQHGMNLATETNMWAAAAAARDWKDGRLSEPLKRHSQDLNVQAESIWMTPNAAGGTGYMSGSNRDTWRPTLEGQAQGKKAVLRQGRPEYSLPAQVIPSGEKPLPVTLGSHRRLNVEFVTWLQGFPPFWTTLGSNPFGASGIHAWRSKLRRRLLCLLGESDA